MQMKKNYVIFDPYYTNREGAWYFAPDEGEFCQGKACYGFGSVKYFDGSVYIGELYYDGETFNKIGYGQQNFIRSRIADLDRRSGLCKNVYVGVSTTARPIGFTVMALCTTWTNEINRCVLPRDFLKACKKSANIRGRLTTICC